MDRAQFIAAESHSGTNILFLAARELLDDAHATLQALAPRSDTAT